MSDSQKQDEKAPLLLRITGIFFLVMFFIGIYYYLFPTEKLKSELAKTYGVSTKVLKKWTQIFCPPTIQDKYLNKTKKVLVRDFYPYLGNPDDRPSDTKGRSILSRKDIQRALFIEETTMRRRMKELENPEEVIGMTRDTFQSLRNFPPKHAALILNYMISKGYDLK